MIGQCKCCGHNTDLRLGFCWECAECESVIADETDMREKEIPTYEGFSKHMNKLHYILTRFKTPKPPYPSTEKTS